ncbi:hypothetical protein [Streptomyces indicus]|uniref:Uncharacterized protein n=1 Tax=Streptomyces indicus TaxID=417292 RepID=A0A1G8WAI6_9ACTN|nr:hypothetical protein [Streptomyces indicus]SDJ74745.1 hypothetical protein SAMN05421806_102312 [Streptomyces indicus]
MITKSTPAPMADAITDTIAAVLEHSPTATPDEAAVEIITTLAVDGWTISALSTMAPDKRMPAIPGPAEAMVCPLYQCLDDRTYTRQQLAEHLGEHTIDELAHAIATDAFGGRAIS